MSDQKPNELQLSISESVRAGVWSNFARVSHSEHEFNIDFVRMDPLVPGTGTVVSRVALSPLMVTQLTEALQKNWKRYAEKALPKEVRDAGTKDHRRDKQSAAPDDGGDGA